MSALKKKLQLHLKKGALHKHAGKSEDKKLTTKDMTIRENDSPHVKKMKQFAQNARKWHK